MCYNKEVSFVLSLFGICCAIKEIRKQELIDIMRGVFMICLVLMQINEFFLHKYNNPRTLGHQFWALMIPISITIQIIYLFISNFILDMPNKETYITSIVTSSIFLIIMTYFVFSVLIPTFNKRAFNSTLMCPQGCRLKWDAPELMFKKNKWLTVISTVAYIITILIGIYVLFGWEMVVVTIVLLIFSYILSLFGNQKGYNRFGSMWCLMAVIFFCAAIITK